MTNKERALAPFHRKSMDRFPMWYGGDIEVTQNMMKTLGAKDENELLYGMLDIDYKTIRPKYIGPALQTFDDGTRMSEWNILRGGSHYGQALTHPLSHAETAEDVLAYDKFPDPDNYDCKFTEQELEWAKDYCLIGGTWAPFFHDSTELMDMEDFFVSMYTNPDVAMKITERCFEVYYELDRRTFKENPGKVDMYFIGNDFGSQRALLMSPDMWRKFYKPFMAKLIGQAKSNGCVTAIHSCGDIHAIIGDLIEIGVDAINPIQVNADNMSAEKLIKEFGSDCVFFGGIDENVILKYGTPHQVREETKRIIDILGSHGRYIVAASHDYILPEIPPENVIAMFEQAKEYGLGNYKF